MFAIATNACLHDHEILAHTVPSWLRVFGDKVSTLWILVDSNPPSGRVGSRQDIDPNRQDLEKCLQKLAALDPRIRLVRVESLETEALSRRWFGRTVSARDQGGFPLQAMIGSFEAPGAELVLRADCDMLFCEQGWLSEASGMLSKCDADLVEPPRCGSETDSATAVSMRALMMKPAIFAERCLPIRTYRLDWLRRVHRRLHGRSTFLSLEEMLEFERKRGRVRHVLLDHSLGFSVHVYDRRLSPQEWFDSVVRRIERGNLTRAQYDEGWNFARNAW